MTDHGPKRLAASLGLENVEALAALVKINGHQITRRTLYKWAVRGAPFDKIENLISWLRAHNLPVATPDKTLSEQIDQITSNATGAQTIAPTNHTTTGDPTAALDYSPAQLAALATRDHKKILTQKAQLEVDEFMRTRIHRDEVAEIIRALAHEVLAGLTDLLPRLLQKTNDVVPSENRNQFREAVQNEIFTLRKHLTDHAPALLSRILNKQGDKQ